MTTSPREKSCMQGYLLVDCCIISKDDYVFVAEKEGYDPWKQLPPTNFVTYRVYKEKSGDPWGCIQFVKNNFFKTKVVHVSDDDFLCVDAGKTTHYKRFFGKKGYEPPIPNDVISRSVYGLQNIQGTIYAVGQPRAVARRDAPTSGP
jgi:hypothetical protein